MAAAKNAKKKKPSAEDIEKSAHRAEIRAIFRQAGFDRISGFTDKNFEFEGRMSELDDVYLFENIVIVAEYTCSKTTHISTHLLKKKVIFDHIAKNKTKFIEFLEAAFPSFEQKRDKLFTPEQCELAIIYASKDTITTAHKKQVTSALYFDYPIVKYFGSLAKAVKKSARTEIFAFLGLSRNQIGEASIKASEDFKKYPGTLLPESHSNFEKGYKIVSFYIDPEALLSKSYVLRRHGWRDELDLYQRLISSKKVNAIRKYLNENDRVFVNNIIVTLPDATQLVDKKGETVDPTTITKIAPVIILIPNDFNVIGLIDGQHRIFAYHEGGDYEEKIGRLRKVQNLLATGIIYPPGITSRNRGKFESKLFLEINSTQTNASSELKQAIGLMLRPFTGESIAKAVINKLSSDGPLEGRFEVRFYEKDKIKTTSIVSYGLRPLVKLSGKDSLFSLWKKKEKDDLIKEKDQTLLDEYIEYCTKELNSFLGAVRASADASQWTTDKKTKNKILSTTALNGLIICFRKLIDEGKTGTNAHYRAKLTGLGTFDFGSYKSSQYGAMSRDLYDEFFK